MDLLKENIANAQNSEDIGTLQALKAMDSLESKLNQVQVAYQQFYTTIGVENVWKGFLDGTKSVIDTLNNLPKLFGAIPLNAVAVIGSAISLVKTIALQGVAQVILQVKNHLKASEGEIVQIAGEIGKNAGQEGINQANNEIKKANFAQTIKKSAGDIVNSIGAVGVMIGAVMDKTTKSGREAAGVVTGLGGAFQAIGGIVNGLVSGNWVGAILTVVTGVINIANGVSIAVETSTEKLERLTQEAENLNNEAKKVKAEYNTLNRSIEKVNELNLKKNESIEATEAYNEAVNELADNFPQLIIGFDDAGNAIINMENAEEMLADARRKTAEATLDSIKGEQEKAKAQEQETYNKIESAFGTFLTPNVDTRTAKNLSPLQYLLTPDLWYGGRLKSILPTGEKLQQALNLPDNFGTYYTFASEEYLNSFKGSKEAKSLIPTFIKLANTEKELYQTEDFQNELLEFQKNIADLHEAGDNFWNSLLNNDQWAELIKLVGELKPLQQTEENLKRSEISQTLIKNYNDQLDTTLLNQLATSYIFTTGTDDYSSAVESIINWWTQLDEEQHTLINNIFNNLQKYSLSDISNLLNFDNLSTEIINSIIDVYNTRAKDVTDQVRAQARNFGFYGRKLNGIWETFNSETGLSLLTEAVNLINKAEEQGLKDNAEKLQEFSKDLFESLSKLSPINRESVENILLAGFSTKEDLATAISAVQTLDLGDAGDTIVTILQDIQSQIVTNYLASLQASYGSNPEKYAKDIKTISKLSKGMDIDEVYNFLTSSLNKVLEEPFNEDSFQIDIEGNYKLADEQLEQFWNSYIDKTYAISEDIQKFYQTLKNGISVDSLLQDSEALAKLGFDLTKINQEDITPEQINQQVEEFKKAYLLANDQIERLREQMLAKLQSNLGNYDQFLGGLNLTEFASFKFGKNDLIKREAQKTLNEAYSNLISDAFSKGIENLNLADYTGLIKGQEIQTTGIKYQEFVEKYIGYTGKTLEEINELIIQAVEKDEAPTQGVKSLIKDINFINQNTAYASLDTIRQLADILQQDVRTMFDPYSFNELLGGYKITNFDFSGIKDAEILVADSVQKFFESLADLIGKGLDGKLSNVDFNNLQQMVESFNLDVNLDFTKTVDGLKLSKQSAIDLYYALREVDSLKAELLFDDIYDSITEAGSGLENISQTTAEIAKLEKEINEAEGDTSGLKERLALLKQIQLAQANNADSYSFMDRKLPEYLQGPENYWNAVGKAFTSMNKAASSGYMEIDDFYNLVNEMTNLANISGNELEFMGQKISGGAEDAAKLINWGFEALSNVDGKGVKISLEKLGANIFTGAEDMGKGFDDAVKEMARSQIKMLDAQIAMLEAVVAMEGLGDLDVDDVKGFSFGDIFKVDKETGDITGYTEQYEQWTADLIKKSETDEDLAKALKSVQFGDQTLYQMFAEKKEATEMTAEEAQQYFAALSSLVKMFESGDYDLKNLLPSILKVADASGYEGEITVEGTKILITQGYTLEQNEEGKYQYGDKVFENVEDATHYMALQKIGAKDTIKDESANVESFAYKGTLEVGSTTIQVSSGTEGVKYLDNAGKPYDSIQAAIKANYGLYLTENSDPNTAGYQEGNNKLSLEAWKIEQDYSVVFTPEETESVTKEQAQNLKEVQWEEFKKEWENKDANEYELQAKYGIKWTSENTEEDFNTLRDKLTGIEHKDVELNLTVTSDNEQLVDLLNSETAEKELKLKVTDVSFENSTDKGLKISGDGAEAVVDELKVTAEKSSYNGDFSITEPIENGTAVVNNLSVGATNVTASGALASLQTLNFTSTSQSLLALNTASSSIGKTSFSNFDKLADVMGTIAEEAETIWNYVQQFADKTFTVEMKQTGEGGESVTVNVDSVAAAATNLGTICSTMITNLDGVTNSLEDFSNSVASMSDVLSKLESLSKILSTLNGQSNAIESLSSMVSKIDNVCRALGNIGRKLDNIPSGVKPLSVKFNYSVSKSNAKGNVALAKGDLEAKAAGTPTLMGELGAELVVSKGRYFLVGQDGAEFVNLDKDAIVFNHLQTQRLLGNGHISSRGIPFTNERNAISLAKGRLNGPAAATPTLQEYIQKTKDKQKEMGISSNGNNTTGSVLTNAYNKVKDAVTSIFSEKISNVRVSPTSTTLPLISYAKGNVHGGPAQASASQALAALKEIRAMWQSMLNASAKDLGQQAGRGGGGKKGGGGGKDWQQKTTTAEIQRWYNLLRQIASLEKDITYEETLQSKLESDRVANGRAMYKSYRTELNYLEKEITANKELAALQKSWYDNKRAELAASDYGKIFTYDENGLQQYVGSGAPGSGLGLDILENLTRTDIYGQAMDNAATAERQLAYLRSVGFNTDNLRFNEDGTQIVLEGLSGEELDNALVQMMENFWDKVDGWRDELDGIYDSYRDQLNNVLSNEEKRNQILQKIVDNQLSVESDVLKAIESREQKRIDDAKKERDALKDTIDKTINGLSDQLNRERELFNNNKSNNDLDKLRRQLAILQRTGGSSTQIRSLQEQIQNQSQEAYFKAQQEQIDAFKQATDEQIERLDEQLKIMEETLEYQKANGLLWKEVYDIMNKTPEQIQDFIINNTPDFQSNSALQVAEDVRELKMKIEQWIEYRENEKNGNSPMTNIDTWDAYFNSIKMLYNNVGTQDYEKARNIYNATLKETGDPNKAAKAAEDSIKNYQKQAAAGVVSSENIGGGITNGTAAVSSADKVSTISGQLQEGSKGDDVKKLQKALNVLGYTDRDNNKLDEDGIFGSKTKQALKKFQDAMGISSDGILGPDTKAKFAIKGYKQGGLAYNTGLAMLHGTKSRPELILNSKSTELIHDMFTNKNSTLTQLIDDYHNSINNTTTNFGANTTTVAERGMTIDKLELNLNVDSIANDYDASRAAEMVANKLMDIARKSGSRSVNRR